MNLKNKVVFITGSSIGIGRADALAFAKEGAKLIITYNTHEKEAQQLADECKKSGSSGLLIVQLDVTNNQSIKRVVNQAIKKFGYIDILINNAGVGVWKPFKEQNFEEIENQIRVNLDGLIKLTNVCLPYIKDMVINISSILGFSVEKNLAVYNATKWGVRGFSKSLALELPNLKVYSVNPAGTATQMNDFLGTPPEKVAEIIVNLAEGKLHKRSGDDVNILDHI